MTKIHFRIFGQWLPPMALYMALMPLIAHATVLNVGPSRHFTGIQQAIAAAKPGDIIKVWPLAGGQPYRRVAVQMKKPRITLESALPGRYVTIDGTGYNYNGRGPIPRAIFQFEPSSSGCVLAGFELTGAHNHSCNGAGVRINAANHITISHCYIHNNDMGIMSNGELAHNTGANQLIQDCLITRNGNLHQAGYNHNLYLGGTSAMIRGCDISHSLTGHNLKSRAHLTCIEYCYLHDSANREMDLVDDRGNTDQPHSDALVIGCIIVKKSNMSGNREVIHFGQDGGANHNGTLYLVHNTIITPYISPVVDLSARGAKIMMIDNKILTTQHHALLVALSHGTALSHVHGHGNFIAPAYGPAGRRMEGSMVSWQMIRLPWARFGLRPGILLRYESLGHLMPYTHPAAGAGPLPHGN